ncbi:MAG: hypothetical protein N3B13_00320 [Deltaproteobacteria bacterium]|nr:hypothetical protein [Deltaproteobacteria bacterium]
MDLVKGISLRILLTIFYCMTVLFHRRVNEFVDIFYKKYSFDITNRFFVYSIIIPLIAFIFIFLWYHLQKFRKIIFVFSLVVIPQILQYRLLFVSNIEAIHYVQYAFISFILIKMSGSIWYSFFASSVLGVIDESYQFLVLYAGHPGVYLDYNDMLLNVHGAIIGILLYVIIDLKQYKYTIAKGSEIT